MKALLFEFLNTQWKMTHGYDGDPLLDSIWIRNYGFKLLGEPIEISEFLSQDLIEFRLWSIEMIQRVIEENEIEESLFTHLNDMMAKTKGIRTIIWSKEQNSITFKALKADKTAFLSELAYLLYLLLTQEDYTRIRICENPDCQFIFYDDSKNKSKRHCHSGCSNIMKVRRFREKKKKNDNGTMAER